MKLKLLVQRRSRLVIISCWRDCSVVDRVPRLKTLQYASWQCVHNPLEALFGVSRQMLDGIMVSRKMAKLKKNFDMRLRIEKNEFCKPVSGSLFLFLNLFLIIGIFQIFPRTANYSKLFVWQSICETGNLAPLMMHKMQIGICLHCRGKL